MTPSFSRFLWTVAFAAVASSAGLQWVGLTAQSEAARHQSSRQKLSEFSSLLGKLDSAPEAEKAEMARQVSGLADNLALQDEKLEQGSRRVVALASYEIAPEENTTVRERLRAEVRGLVGQAESLEADALSRANRFVATSQIALFAGLALFAGVLRVTRVRKPEVSGI
ncbi:MAG: hypothetical protein FJW38_14470 [Acidobacteria bacterium]|nr:hypothetical protein [Acidobacteriota bacterium]